MVKIPRRQILQEKTEPYTSNKGADLKLAGEGLNLVGKTTEHIVDRTKPFAEAARGTDKDIPAYNFIRDITGINNQFAMVDLEGNAKIAATKANADLQKKWADNPTCPEFQAEVDQAIGQIFDADTSDVPVSQQLNWQKAKQSTLQAFKKANMEWAEKQSLSNLNRRVKKMNEEANNRANFYGENDSLDEFMSDNATARNLLSGMADDFGMSKEQKTAMLSAFDTQQIFNYLKGLAKNNPDKAEAIVNNDDALALMLGTEGRKDLASAVKTAKTKKAKELTAELGMPSHWGDVTKRATMAYADRLQAQGLERADAIKEATRRMKEQEDNLSRQLSSANLPEEKKKELQAQLDTFTSAGPQEEDYGGFTDEDWEKLSADEQREALKRDLEKHIRKGRELQKTRASDLAKAQMYDEFNAFISNPSESAITERKLKPEYYLDANYKKLTDAMADWYKLSLEVSKAEETTPQGLSTVLQALLLPEMQGTEKQAEILTDAFKNMSSVAGSNEITQSDKEVATNAIRVAVQDEQVRQQLQKIARTDEQLLEQFEADVLTDYNNTDPKLKRQKFKSVMRVMRDFKTNKPVGFAVAGNTPVYLSEGGTGSVKPGIFVGQSKYNAQANKAIVKYKTFANYNKMALVAALQGNIDESNAIIERRPYALAEIEYAGVLGFNTDNLDKFYEYDTGDKSGKRPQFMYNGTNFEYLGMNPDGTIIGRRMANQ